MPAFTPKGIKYPLPADAIKSAASSSKLADDFKELSVTADAAIDSAIGSLPARVTAVEAKNVSQDADIKFVTDRTRTVSSNPPTNASAPVGILHYDELLGQLWVKTSQPGTSEWKPVMLQSRGIVGSQNIDNWKDADHNGWWDIRSTEAARLAGSTLPAFSTDQTVLLEQLSTLNRITFQSLYMIEGGGYLGAVFKRARYGYESATWGPWRKEGVDGSRGRILGANIDSWHDALRDGRYDIWNPTDMASLRTAGSTLPYGFSAGQLEHISTANRMGTEFLYGTTADDGRVWHRTNRGWVADPADGKFGDWRTFSMGANTPMQANDMFINCIGDSQVKGFNSGTGTWDFSDSWPGKLQEALGGVATVRNRATVSATVDEILAQNDVRALKIKPSTAIPGSSSGSTGVTLSREIVSYAGRAIALEGTYRDVAVVLNRSTTGSWTISRAVTGDAIYDIGWEAFVPAWGKPTRDGYGADDGLIVWFGGNNASSEINGYESSTAEHILAAYADAARWQSSLRPNFLFLGLTTRAQDVTGTPRNLAAVEVNTRLPQLYPGHFFNVQEWLRNDALSEMGVTPTQEDIDMVAAGTVPRSVLAVGDSTHISKQTASALATRLAPILLAKGFAARP